MRCGELLTIKNEPNLTESQTNKIVQFATTGMNFDKVCNTHKFAEIACELFWLEQIRCATHVLTAYDDDELVGVLVAHMVGQKRVCDEARIKGAFVALNMIMVDFMDWDYRHFDIQTSCACEEMVKEAIADGTKIDGEISFLVVDPNRKHSGIGTALLNEFANIANDKNIFLLTDSLCDYQYYDRQGFSQLKKRSVPFKNEKFKGENIDCFLYTKQF